jgi:ABC-2 type transport system permease protein
MKRTSVEYTLAAYIQGKPVESSKAQQPKDGKKKPEPKEVKVVWIGDADFCGDLFFNFRRQGERRLDFENVGFLINCVDYLAGDESLIALRQKRAARHTLTTIIKLSEEFEKAQQTKREKALAEKDKAVAEAQAKMDKATVDLNKQENISLKDIVEVQRKAAVAKREYEATVEGLTRKYNDETREDQIETQRKVRSWQDFIRLCAIFVPAIPVFALGMVVWAVRSSRETEGVSRSRLV